MKKKLLLPKSASGQSLVELAVSLVILLYLLAGAAEFGIIFFQYVQLRDAAQEGALYGSIHPTEFALIEARARDSSASPINLDVAPATTVKIYINDVLVRENGVDKVAVVDVEDTACEANAVAVHVSYDHKIFMPFLPRVIGSIVPLNGIVTDTILTPVCP